ncbi:ATP-binding cassette domain-containing protein [Mycolicibacterium komossense]|uniref:ABC transporter ATP-binding protein n=1 Tax=Mycolicibacterium komossense TaxID=1779 RepID=A0ABT3CK53_9MYCO|nr:ABC transporter ATP-binding protein [Mycolicibacterium komossense]MCV7229807.1 ABC transporter ATP-binding protein [Mycolicibacterium komossense]
MTATTVRMDLTAEVPDGHRADLDRSVDWRRLRAPGAAVALVAMAIAAVLQSLSTVVLGRLAATPTWTMIAALAACALGYALLNTAGSTVWGVVADRAEGRLRGDLLAAALNQPLERLSEQAVGEVLDRVDDDTHEVGALVRSQLWDAMRTVVSVLPMWIVAGLTWWPAWIIFPIIGPLAIGIVRGPLRQLSERKVLEEAAWTEHAAAMEEGIAARDDLRTSLGQAYVLRRVAELSGVVQRRLLSVVAVESRITLRAGGLLHAFLAAVVVAGVALVAVGDLDIAQLVTLFFVSATLVGEVALLARQFPELQAGMGAVIRLRQLAASPSEPIGGQQFPVGSADIEFHDLHFAYTEGVFALDRITLHVKAGTTCAFVGRTGSGKSTLASLVSRAVDPEPGSLTIGGVDVLELDLQQLRASVGVVTQRTEILAGTLAENVALFADVPRDRVRGAIAELDLTDWVESLPDGLDTLLGPGGTTLSAGEEQLVAFARLLVRAVHVVVLDEATARMDPLTETRVIRAADRLLANRTGILIAHRLSTVMRADQVAVLEGGRLIDHGPRRELESRPGPFRRLLDAAGADDDPPATEEGSVIGGARRPGAALESTDVDGGPSLARGILHMVRTYPTWGLLGASLFALTGLLGSTGAISGFVWGHVVEDLQQGQTPVLLTAASVLCILAEPFVLVLAIRRFVPWWSACSLRIRMTVLDRQTRQHRLARTPPGEVVSRVLDADRFLHYADLCNDVVAGLVIVVIASLLGGTAIAGAILLAVMVTAAVASVAGRPIAGRSATAASATRADFGRALVSALECVRTVKLSAATQHLHAHLDRVDAGRVGAAVREHRVQTVLLGVPVLMVELGVVAVWGLYLLGAWNLATALLVSGAVGGFGYFGSVAGGVVTQAPGTRAWQLATSRFAGGADLMDIPPGIDLIAGAAPRPMAPQRIPLHRLELRNVTAVHDDGTRGVTGVDLTVDAGELVLLLGQVGSGKSSLLSTLCGLVGHTGEIYWNGVLITDAQTFLRPSQIAHVAQVPRVLSGTFADNVLLDHDREIERAVADACLAPDIAAAGGLDAIVGHRGVRLSGGQVQRLALARALAVEPELLLADDISSAVDAATEVQLWAGLRARGMTVLGATAKRAALAQADRVVVLVDGQVAEVGRWTVLAPRWNHLAA